METERGIVIVVGHLNATSKIGEVNDIFIVNNKEEKVQLNRREGTFIIHAPRIIDDGYFQQNNKKRYNRNKFKK
jgi:hypothetical protein